MLSPLVSLTLLSLSSATVLPVCTVEKFDNLKTNPIAGVFNKAPVIDGLDFTQFRVITSGDIIQAASKPNVIVAGTPSTLTNGEITIYPRAAITAVNNVRAFDLTRVRYACKLNTVVGLVSAPATPCTISVSGYTTDGKSVSETTFSYAPTGDSSNPMGVRDFGLLRGLKNVTFEVLSAGTLPAAVASLELDDVTVCRYYE